MPNNRFLAVVSEIDQNSVNQFDAYILSIETQKSEKKQ